MKTNVFCPSLSAITLPLHKKLKALTDTIPFKQASFKQAMILAAGLGMRMRPLTDTCPKPLLKVGGVTLLDHSVKLLHDGGVRYIGLNSHHLADQLAAWVEQARQRYPDITFHLLHEPALLNSGGGLRNALSLFDDEPLLVLNPDNLWWDFPQNPCQLLAQHWRDSMATLLMMADKATAETLREPASFQLHDGGRLSYHPAGTPPPPDPHYYASIHVVQPRVLKTLPIWPFNLHTDFWEKRVAHGDLYGVPYRGRWLQLSTPEDLMLAEQVFANQAKA